MDFKSDLSRRNFFRKAAFILAAALPLAGMFKNSKHAFAAEKPEEQVPPGEDLMREHGVLERILLIYDEALKRIQAKRDIDPAIIAGAAKIN